MIALWLLFAASPALGKTEITQIKAVAVAYDFAKISLAKKSFDQAITQFR
jgi:hypothetical protein